MKTKSKIEISKDTANKKINIVRSFEAPRELVWDAWTKSSLLDKWWAPKPWAAVTETMDFSEGGHWLYYMLGPDGIKAWACMDYITIRPQNSFTAQDSFCDEQGNKTADLPSMHWEVKFLETTTGTKVQVEITFAAEADITKIIEMGFEEGFTAALENLDELLEKNQ